MALFTSGSAGATPQPSLTTQEGKPMGLNEYEVEIDGRQTTLQLSDEDAALHGLKKPTETKAKTPANKAAQPSNKGSAKQSGGKSEA